MDHTRLHTVVLVRDIPEHDLCAGDLGAVVEVYPPDGLEVEFVTASGRTKALVTLTRVTFVRLRIRTLLRFAPSSAPHKASRRITDR